MGLGIDSAEAIKDLERRVNDARVTRKALCERAGVDYSLFCRGRRGRMLVGTLDRLETAMKEIEAERAA